VELKNQFFELALDANQYDFAIEGFLSNRRPVNTKTRLHLEATALLAIAYLRKGDIEKAKPFIKDVLQNRNIIKSPTTRAKFNKEIITRFDEEMLYFP
jgi:Tfp pilus assembly protein PilF